jgi:hypothetical protein
MISWWGYRPVRSARIDSQLTSETGQANFHEYEIVAISE